jgi:uncharacterized protein (TIGR03435 family)
MRSPCEAIGIRKELLLSATGLAAAAALIVVGLASSAPSLAQSANAVRPQFDVASIKPCTSGVLPSAGGGGRASLGNASPSPGRFSVKCQPVKALITMAYVLFEGGKPRGASSLKLLPVVGGPGWIDSEAYTINAETEDNASPALMEGPMLQALLEDRFKVKTHRETKEVSVYDLTVAKSGFKLHEAKEGSCTTVDFANLERPRPEPGEKPYCGQVVIRMKGPNWAVEVHSMTLDEFSKWLDSGLDRIVANKTGIAGKFDFQLEFAPDETTPGYRSMSKDGDELSGAPSLFSVLQQQFGLKLVPSKGPGDFLVIDSVERPSGN